MPNADQQYLQGACRASLCLFANNKFDIELIGDKKNMMHKVVSQAEWEKAHAEFLKKEKEFTRMRDQLVKQRQELPWIQVEKKYTFDTATGKKTLGELFDGKHQLFLQHFMFAPKWEEGCPGCSFQADHIDGTLPHLAARDVSYVAVSRAPLAALEAYKKRMGWKFNWVSSLESDFNFDFHVSFSEKDQTAGKVFYNHSEMPYAGEELPGNSIFYKDASGLIFYTYSAFARGCEPLLTTYAILDMMPKGRDEAHFKNNPMEWVKRHDRYESQ